MDTCYICGNDRSISEEFIIEDGISLGICLSCAGKCESCADKGYLEVTHPDFCEYIEACENCNGFSVGNIGDFTGAHKRARKQAIKDGYKLNNKGKILCN